MRVLLSLGLVFLTKLVQTPWLLSSLFQLERELDPVSCQVLCMTVSSVCFGLSYPLV